MVSKGLSRCGGDFILCGWRVWSELPLAPDLPPWAGDDRPPDLRIRLGPVAELGDAVERTPFLQVGGDGRCRLAVSAVAHILIQGGREMVVEPHPGATPAELRTFLLGPALGLLCHQRGLFPLHAACVRVGAGAVALAGASGTGKSTLAAVLAGRGHWVLADDVCVVDAAAAGGPSALPGYPRLKLWRCVVEAFALAPDQLEANRVGQEKYHLVLAPPGGLVSGLVPLRAVVLLSDPAGSAAAVLSPVVGEDAAAALAELVYRRRAALAMGRGAALAGAITGPLATVPMFRLDRGSGLAHLDAQAELLEGLLPP